MNRQVVDRKPFEYYTLLQSVNSLDYLHTRRLVLTKEGCRLCVYASKPLQDVCEELRNYVQAEYNRGFGNLRGFIEQDIANGKVTVSDQMAFTSVAFQERGTHASN